MRILQVRNIPDDVFRVLKHAAADQDITLSELVRRLMTEAALHQAESEARAAS